MRARAGSALSFVLLLLIVLDCVVLGTLHLSLQEHRIGANRTLLLKLRLEAESAIRRTAGHWSIDIDTMQVGPAARRRIEGAGSGSTAVHIERLTAGLFVVDAQAVEPPPRSGRYAARQLFRPPALPPDIDPAIAPLSIHAVVHMTGTGSVETASTCLATPPEHGLLVAPSATVTLDPGHSIDGTIGDLGARSVLADLERLIELSAVADSLSIVQDTILTEPVRGVLIARGDVRIGPGASFRGLLVAGGELDVEAGAEIEGAVHARSARIAGVVRWDGCAVRLAVGASGIGRPAPPDGRSWIPAF